MLKKIVFAVMAVAFALAFCASCGEEDSKFDLDNPYSNYISQEEAYQIARDNVSDDKLEPTSALLGPYSKNHDVIIWTVNLAGGQDIVFVNLDAMTGQIYSQERYISAGKENRKDDDKLKSGGMCANYCRWYLYVNIPGFYSQRDYHWSNETLGYGPTTIGTHGCHLTTVSMILYRLGWRDRNPSQLNNYAKSNGCFDEDFLDGPCIMRRHGHDGQNIGVDEIWGYLQRGIPVVAAVKYGRGRHFMLIYGHDGRRYWVKDPWQDGAHQDQPLYGEYAGTDTYRVYD